MALTKIQKSAFQNTKKHIKLLIKEIEKDALAKINKAISCGALDEESDFLQPNSLLARVLIEEVSEEYKIKSRDYIKEADNLRLFL